MHARRHNIARAARTIVAVTAVLLAARAVAPASAHAADLFPVDDWLGDGIKKATDVVLGPLTLGAKEIARLLATIIGALADLLIPKSLVRAGLDGVRWLVQLPPVGTEVSASGAVAGVRMPHLVELRGVLTWIGVTLLPLGIVMTAGRAFLTPGVDTESPGEVLARALVAGLGLLLYDWTWGVVVRLSRLITDALLGLPWVADGVERMLETLLIGGAAGTAVAAEFVIPLLVLCAGGALLALLLLHVGLDVATALVYVSGGLVLGASVTGIGRRLLSAWLVAASAVVLVPVLWAIVFVTGAALMLDAKPAGGPGFAGFVVQLYNVAAALAVFVVAIKLARGVFRQAGGAIGGLATGPAAAGSGGAGRAAQAAGAGRGLPANATPAGLARFSRQLRGGVRAGAAACARGVSWPLRHPATTAGATSWRAQHPVQGTQHAAGVLRASLADGRVTGATVGDVAYAHAARPARSAAATYTRAAAGPGASAAPPGPAGAGRPGSGAGPRRVRFERLPARPSAPTRPPGTPGAQTPTPVSSRTAGVGRVPTDAVARAGQVSRARPAARWSTPRPWWVGRPRKPRGGDERRERGS